MKLVKEAFRLIYRSKYNTCQAVEAMRKELPQTDEITEIIQFIEQSERGTPRVQAIQKLKLIVEGLKSSEVQKSQLSTINFCDGYRLTPDGLTFLEC